MIKKILLFLIPFVIATVGIFVYFKLNQKLTTFPVPSIPSVSFSDLIKFSRFSLEKAPTASLVGTITDMNGDVMFTSRLATESAKLNFPREVQQGESLATGDNSGLVLNFKEAAEIKFNADTEVEIIQTIPVDLVFLQKRGTVNYKKLSESPVSIRSYHLLVENNGELTFFVDNDKKVIQISIISGSANLVYNDKNNNTNFLTVGAGKSVSFNDDTRQVDLE